VSPDAVALALGAVLVLGAAIWAAAPLWRPHRTPALPDLGLAQLLAEREAVIDGLRDLDAELAAGRIDSGEFARQREDLMRHGSAVLAAIESRAAGEAEP
jgi:hypothetical protein